MALFNSEGPQSGAITNTVTSAINRDRAQGRYGGRRFTGNDGLLKIFQTRSVRALATGADKLAPIVDIPAPAPAPEPAAVSDDSCVQTTEIEALRAKHEASIDRLEAITEKAPKYDLEQWNTINKMRVALLEEILANAQAIAGSTKQPDGSRQEDVAVPKVTEALVKLRCAKIDKRMEELRDAIRRIDASFDRTEAEYKKLLAKMDKYGAKLKKLARMRKIGDKKLDDMQELDNMQELDDVRAQGDIECRLAALQATIKAKLAEAEDDVFSRPSSDLGSMFIY
ncbi:hypothetical protein B0T26DRAFT_719550 [Lasiosphaeria miniovina]|uniref:Uncharacterized protein n=1 Tax=Lasiosphaeria miniovina TaxID=1954250 RepID=A0AA40DSQ3_9PEZI|nr:uncharacterized protein B0T26DRAFT_719550 [Lasiosphaeria miniovina]KAK0714110.1 hypothetical protein B0T26DRAFT_719550 [Lasiosphaeria miniovina]